MILEWIRRRFGKRETSLDVLRQIPLFRDLDERGRSTISGLLERRRFEAQEIIFRQDQPGLGMYVVLEGEVDILRDDEDGSRIRLGRVSAGGFFGEMALLDESPLSATAQATMAAEAALLHRSDLLALAERDPILGVRIVMPLSQLVADRLRRTNRSLRSARDELDVLHKKTEAAAEESPGEGAG